MVRSYTRHVPILRTFFISEFRGSRSSGLTCQKNIQKLSRGKLSRGKLSRGKLSKNLSRGNLSRGKLLLSRGETGMELTVFPALVMLDVLATATLDLHAVRARYWTPCRSQKPAHSNGRFWQLRRVNSLIHSPTYIPSCLACMSRELGA
jgi:hypothetical protein